MATRVTRNAFDGIGDEEWSEAAFQLDALAERIREAVESGEPTGQRLRRFILDERCAALMAAAVAFGKKG